MARALPLPVPCPVQLGSVRGDSLEAQLHEYVREGNCEKVKRLLEKGVFVDAVNSMGQTSLFTAALLGLGKIVDVLLDYGSDANHRCYDGSTPVHAASFSGNQWILSRLLDEGGDLRVHDKDGKTPQYWAMSAGKKSGVQMLEFIERCTFHMQAAIQNFHSDLLRKAGSSKMLVCSPSRFGGLVQGNVDSPLGRFLKGGASAAKTIYSFGFGKFYLAGSGRLGYLASLPVIGEKDVVQADDEPTFSYHVGPYMVMTNLMWGCSRVTVKELSLKPHQNCSQLRLADLLIAEQEHSSKLHHPHLLQLMSVCLSSDLKKTRLVYERVNFGSLYSILHERRTEFPVLHIETILHVLLQINDALRFLHSRGFIHRTVTSYAIQIVSSGVAKLCNLEYMIESKDGGEHSDLTRIPVPVQLYKWCSPEVILEKVVTVRSDIYSFCTVVQEALTETPPWKGVEDSVIKQFVISGQQLEADVRLPLPYYGIIKAGLEPKQKNRSTKLHDIRYILEKDLKDLTKSQTGPADDLSKAQRPAGFANVNICLASAFRYHERTEELQRREITEADSSTAPRHSGFPEENSALGDQAAATSLQPVAQDKSRGVSSELQASLSVSDVDDSLSSFEINEILAGYPELCEDFLEEGSGLGQTLKDEQRQQEEEDKASFRDPYASPGVHCEEEPVHAEGGFSESSTEFTTEEEERIGEASVPCVQVRGDAGRRASSLSQNMEHIISRCVLDVKILQSMCQQAADSLCRTEEKLNKSEATEKQKLSEQGFQEGHWNRSDDASQNASNTFSGVNTFLWKAIGPPSRGYIPPVIICQAQGRLTGESFHVVSKTEKEMLAIENEKQKCFHELSESKNENTPRDLGFSVVNSLDDQVRVGHEHLLPRLSVRCKKKFNLQCQRGDGSHSAASGSEEERCWISKTYWYCPKPRCEICSTAGSEERGLMRSEWQAEVKQMARRVASGQLELGSPYPVSECTSESEAGSVKEAFQHVTVRAQRSQDQERCRWQTGDNAEPWDLGSKARSEPEESGLESAFRRSGGRSCQSPSRDDQAESGIAVHRNSVLPQAENLSRGLSRELHGSRNSSPDAAEEFFTSDSDRFLPHATRGSSELEVKIAEKAGVKPELRTLGTSDAEGGSEGACEGVLQKQRPEDAGSGIQVSVQNQPPNLLATFLFYPRAEFSLCAQLALEPVLAKPSNGEHLLFVFRGRNPVPQHRGAELRQEHARSEAAEPCASTQVTLAHAWRLAVPPAKHEVFLPRISVFQQWRSGFFKPPSLPAAQLSSCSSSLSSLSLSPCGRAEFPGSEVGSKGVNLALSVEAAQEVIPWEPQEESKEQDVSVADIQDLSSITYERGNHGRDIDCTTPGVSHAPRRVSTPLSSGAFEKHNRCQEVASESSFCASRDISSAGSRTFTTAYEEGRSTEIPSVASGVSSSEWNEPDGLPVASSLGSTRKASALSQASACFSDELPPPAQELLDEIGERPFTPDGQQLACGAGVASTEVDSVQAGFLKGVLEQGVFSLKTSAAGQLCRSGCGVQMVSCLRDRVGRLAGLRCRNSSSASLVPRQRHLCLNPATRPAAVGVGGRCPTRDSSGGLCAAKGDKWESGQELPWLDPQEYLGVGAPEQIHTEDRESETESERNEGRNHRLWTRESFSLSEETERAHSTLDDVLDRMLPAVPGEEEVQEQPRGAPQGWLIADCS
ncbi:inactive serine/threonine-protein kinase TEX14 [Rhynochetos jubatus]